MIEAFVLGIVQGLTEFLPISSSAHLIVVPALMGWEYPGLAFSAVLHIGSLLSLLIYMRRDLALLAVGSWDAALPQEARDRNRRTVAAILLATVPVGIIGLLVDDAIENLPYPLPIIAAALIVFALILAIAERRGRRSRGLAELGFWEIQVVGLAQALALVPGASRSGVTLTACLFLGLRRDEAARFAFLVGIPAVSAAGLLKLKDLLEAGVSADEGIRLAIGVAAAFVAGCAAMHVMIRYLRTHSTFAFIAYRVCLGVSILWLIGIGRL